MSTDPQDYARVLQRLVPAPRKIDVSNGRFKVTESLRLKVFSGDCSLARFAAERFAELLSDEHGLDLPIECAQREGPFQIVLSRTPEDIVVSPVPSEQAQGYVLNVFGDAALVTAASEKGLFHGAMTLWQLISSDDQGLYLPGVHIEDWPRYNWRGFAVDSGRAVNSLPKIKRMIRVCSTFKLNFMLFREGDDELAAVRYNTNRLGSGNPYALTMEQIEDMIAYGEKYGVTVIPEIESLGHSTAKGFDYPEIVSGGFEHKYGDLVTHIRKSHLQPADPRSYELLESIYDEWFGRMRTPLVHLGLDEVRLEKDIQAEHLAGLLPVVDRVGQKYGKQIAPIVWADAPPTPEEWQDRVIRCLWHYGDTQWHVNFEYEHLIRQGIRELGEPGCAEYVFMAAGCGSGHTPYSKTPHSEAFENIAEWAILGKHRTNFIGLLAVQWSGNNLDEWLPDFAAAADAAWNPPDDIPAFEPWLERTQYQLGRLNDAANPSPAEVDPDCWDGIFLKDGDWYEDIMTGKKRG